MGGMSAYGAAGSQPQRAEGAAEGRIVLKLVLQVLGGLAWEDQQHRGEWKREGREGKGVTRGLAMANDLYIHRIQRFTNVQSL